MKFQMTSVASIKVKELSLMGKSSNEGSIPVPMLTAKAALALRDLGSWCQGSGVLPAWFPQPARAVLLLCAPVAPASPGSLLGSLGGARPWGQEISVFWWDWKLTSWSWGAQRAPSTWQGLALALAQQSWCWAQGWGGTEPGLGEARQGLRNHFTAWSWCRFKNNPQNRVQGEFGQRSQAGIAGAVQSQDLDLMILLDLTQEIL